MEWEWMSCMKHARRAKGQAGVMQNKATRMKLRNKHSTVASLGKWRCSIPHPLAGWLAWKTNTRPVISHIELTPSEQGKRRLRMSVRKVTCEDGRLNPVESWLTEGPQCWCLTGSPWLAAPTACKANDAFCCSHICFPPWPHVLWVNAGPPWLNNGDPVTNDVLFGLLCIRPRINMWSRMLAKLVHFWCGGSWSKCTWSGDVLFSKLLP